MLYSSYLPLGVSQRTCVFTSSTSFLAPLPGRKRISARGVSHFQSLYFVIVLLFYLLYNACYQWLISLKLDLIGKVGSRKNNKNIISNTACHKNGNTYGNKLINCISLLETCALLIILLIALINLVAVGGINTSLFNVSITIMLPYLLMLREIMTLMM